MESIWIDEGDYVKLACEFADVAIERFEGLGIYNGDYKTNVALVNAALSVELFLKSTLAVRKFNAEAVTAEREGFSVVIHHSTLDQEKDSRTHSVVALFSKLSKANAAAILDATLGNLNGINSISDFSNFLERVDGFFVEKRYPSKGVSFGSNDYLLFGQFIDFLKILVGVYQGTPKEKAMRKITCGLSRQ